MPNIEVVFNRVHKEFGDKRFIIEQGERRIFSFTRRHDTKGMIVACSQDGESGSVDIWSTFQVIEFIHNTGEDVPTPQVPTLMHFLSRAFPLMEVRLSNAMIARLNLRR